MMLSKLQVHVGEIPPMGYARAWDVPGMDASVFYPFPLNIFAGLGRKLWLDLKWRTGSQAMRDEALDKAYSDGFARGHEQEREHQEALYPSLVQIACAAAYEQGQREQRRLDMQEPR